MWRQSKTPCKAAAKVNYASDEISSMSDGEAEMKCWSPGRSAASFRALQSERTTA
jgi:hypothetical protein